MHLNHYLETIYGFRCSVRDKFNYPTEISMIYITAHKSLALFNWNKENETWTI